MHAVDIATDLVEAFNAGDLDRMRELFAPDLVAWVTKADGEADRQPVWLTHLDENPNGAAFLFVADRARSERLADYKRCFELFDGRDDTAVADSRERWKAYKAAGHTLAYWQQTATGGWEKKA